jgi:acetolactate synthase-1/2/3 large subunit
MQPSMPDFVKLAAAYGVKGIAISQREQLADAIAEMLAHNGPVLMDVKVSRDENCYPMVAPGKSNSQMIGLPIQKNLAQSIELIYCPSCGAKNVTNNKFCPDCGAKL